jgi:hypothetical protein
LGPEAGVVRFGGEGRPPVPEGFIRLYRGGEGSSFFTPVEKRAGSFSPESGEGVFVDVPREVYERGKVEAAKLGQPTPDDTYLPDEWVKRSQSTTLERDVYEAQDTGQSVEDILKELEVEPLPPERPGTPEVPPEKVQAISPAATDAREAAAREELKATLGPEGMAELERQMMEKLGMEGKGPLQEEADLYTKRPDLEEVGREEFLGRVEPPESVVRVEGIPEGQKGVQSSSMEGGPEGIPEGAPAIAPERKPGPMNGIVEPPPAPGGTPAAPSGRTIEESQARLAELKKQKGELESQLKKSELNPEEVMDLEERANAVDAEIKTLEETVAEIPSPVKPPEKPALEAKPSPQSFADFMNQKFGERQTTAKERALARAEWQQLKDERHIMKLAEKAGIPPDRLKGLLEGMPKPSEEVSNLSAWRRAAMPVIDNLGKVHPWLRDAFEKYVSESERPAAKMIADSYRIKHVLSRAEQREVIELLDGKKPFEQASNPKVAQAAGHYRSMLDTVWNDAVAANVVSGAKRQNYFPHKFAEGWDDNLLRMPQLDKNWNLRDPHLEKSRMTKRGDYRRDLGVLDEYFMSAYRRISEVQNFGKRLEVLRRFLRKMPMGKATSDWLHTNIRRVMGREAPGTFDIISGHARHIQALTDLGLAAFYQPIQGVNVALYGGFGRSARALMRIARDYPNEVYDAMRSGALTPAITQEIIQGAYGAAEGIKSTKLSKFMFGIPTIDKWTRIVGNTAGKLLVEDARKGNSAALRDIHTLVGKEFKLDAADAYDVVGKALSDKALFRTGTLEVPGWASSGYGKLATQYTRFMYRHSLFVSGLFKDAAQGNVVPLARFLVAAGTVIPGMAEALYPLREGLRTTIKQGVSGEFDPEKIKEEALGDPHAWNTEVGWTDVLRNRRIPWDHPLKRYLQNLTLWGGLGVFQIAVERASRGGGAFERGARGLVGPVPANVYEGVGAVPADIDRALHGEWPRYTPRWVLQQVPVAGYPLASEAFPPVGAWSRRRPRRRR